MSFEQMTVEELKEVFEYFGSDYNPTLTAALLARKLDEDGVTYEMWTEMHPAPEAEQIPVPVGAIPVITDEAPIQTTPKIETMVLKMNRENPLYEIRGVRFTKNNPYAIVPIADAEYILTHEEGFRQATPTELAEFYG